MCFRLPPFHHEEVRFCQGLNLLARFAFRSILNCNLNHIMNVYIYHNFQTFTNSLILADEAWHSFLIQTIQKQCKQHKTQYKKY
jgi:hypothetical protein